MKGTKKKPIELKKSRRDWAYLYTSRKAASPLPLPLSPSLVLACARLKKIIN